MNTDLFKMSTKNRITPGGGAERGGGLDYFSLMTRSLFLDWIENDPTNRKIWMIFLMRRKFPL